MGVALNKMVQEDPSFQVATDEETGETLIKGMGELHLDIKVDILRRTHGVDVEMGKPQVAYRETITQTVEDSYTHKKQTGGSGQYAKIDYRIEPGEVNAATSSNRRSPAATCRASTGRRSRRRSRQPGRGHAGRLSDAGRQVHAAGRRLPRGRLVGLAFEIGDQGGLPPVRAEGRPQLLEPIMKVDVFTPDDHVGDVIGDLNRRRGMIKSQDAG